MSTQEYMSPEEFDSVRQKLRNFWADRTTAEIRALRHMFENLAKMYPYQIGYLINDLNLMESYKNTHPSIKDEFQRIMKGMHEKD